MRRWILYIWLLLLFAAISCLFYYNEWQYSLPTPVPKGYLAVATGTIIPLPQTENNTAGKPVFLHFFNPDCPCSKFNIEHVRKLIKNYGSRVSFQIVLVTTKDYTDKEIQDRFNIHVPILRDSAIAARCGAYSTPQAVILDEGHHLFYRGNYNRSRYCTDQKTNYAQTALEGLLQKNNYTVTEPLAVKAYGCRLPGCTQP